MVTEGKTFPDNSLIVGAPARVIRTLDEKAAQMIRGGADIYVRRWKQYAKGLKRLIDFILRMILSENRFPLFGIMREPHP